MKKTINKEVYVCDYCLKEGREVEAVGKVQPSEEDVCSQHFAAFQQEARLPKEAGEEMSGLRLPVTPGFNAKMKIVYKEEV